MKIKVMYHSMTGNTKKVAEAIAAAVGIVAEKVQGAETFSESIDLLFVGDGIYAGGMSRKTKAFLQGLESGWVKHAAVFGTYGGEDTVITAMKALLKEKGIAVCEERFVCVGQAFFVANKNRPNQEDLDNAADFAKRIVQMVSEG